MCVEKETNMNSNGKSQEYTVSFKVHLQPDGSALIIAGSIRLVLSAFQVQALIDGRLGVGQTLAGLHRELDTVILELLEKRDRM